MSMEARAMAETLQPTAGMTRDEAYDVMEADLAAVLDGDERLDLVARMATVACVLHHGLGTLWTGFYRARPDGSLVVGPYQGSLGCLEIAAGRGVCGRAAADRQSVVVPEVSRFPGHIACDARSRSEIVVPVLDERGGIVAVLDLDSDRPSAFDEQDARRLERLVARFVREPVVRPRA
jgi:L-methionine (R)-S-oxide reductase